MARARWQALVSVLFLLGEGCRPPAPSSTPAEPADCPEPPADLSPIEEVRQLSQVAREARANLMVRLEQDDGQRFATLHPPELALMEAVLVEPARARRLDPAWLRRHLLRATLELHSRQPLPSLDGDLRQALLVDDRGRRFPALGLAARSDSHGWTYRFLLDPRAMRGEGDIRLRFQVPGEQGLEARWALSRRVLEGLEDQPVVFHLSRLRELSWARWRLLQGELGEARAIVEDVLACAPELEPARRLRSALATPPAPLAAASLPLPAGPRPLASDSSQDAVREIALRGELLLALGAGFASGLLRSEELAAAQQDLRSAAAALSRSAEPAVVEALLAFDERLARLLAEGLDVSVAPGGPRPVRPLRPVGFSLRPAEVAAELGSRLAMASSGLRPRWVAAPSARDEERALFEMRPLLQAQADGELHLAKPHQRLGRGWLHPGLPDLRFRLALEDQGGEYWAGEAGRSRDLASLRAVARRLLEQEMAGPTEASAALAMQGMAELAAAEARRRLLPLLGGDPLRAASALRALATAGGPEAEAALRRAARSANARLRAAALEGLGRLGHAEDRPLLRAGLRDADPAVALSAVVALARQRDGQALELARGWLEGEPARRRALLSAAASSAGLEPLGKDLLRLLRGASTEPGVVAAVARNLRAAAAGPLGRLYGEAPALRLEVLRAAAGPAFQALLLRAAAESDSELRRLALARLAELRQPPRGPFVEALAAQDPRLRLLGNLGLARLGQADALLALAQAARGSCEERALVLRPVAVALDAVGRSRLLRESLLGRCPELAAPAWELVVEHHPEDLALLRAGLAHSQRQIRIQAALLALGLRRGAALGSVP